MKTRKRCLIMIMVLIIGGISGYSFLNINNHNKNKTNVYRVEAKGYGGMMVVDVTFDDDRISDIEIIKHNETYGTSDGVIYDVPKAIIENQSLLVDTQSGATISYNALISAISQAIRNANLLVADYQVAIESFHIDHLEPIKLYSDVIIVGSGGAGMSSAATIVEHGGNAIIIEKMANYGGNTLIAAGTQNAVDPLRQARQNISDSLDLYIKQTYEYGDKKGDIDLIRELCTLSLDARNWLSSFGGKWSEEIYQTIGGLWPRSMNVETYGDTLHMYLEPLLNYIKANSNIELMLNVRAEELIMENGEVIGVYAKNEQNGQEYYLYGDKGVILATGGYSANMQMIQTFNNSLPLSTSNHAGATGDGISLAQRVNASIEGMEYIQIHPHGNPKSGALQSEIAGDVEKSIYVNLAGKRFVNEMGTWNEISSAVLKQPLKVMYAIYDSQVDLNNVEKYLASKDLISASSIEDLAILIGIDQATLITSIEEYNNNHKNNVEDPFNKVYEHEIKEAPFYACMLKPVYHYTMGGIKINKNAEVIDINHNIINGLYAAGEVVGGIHGSNRLGGNSMSEIVVFGRIAGERAILKK